MMILLSPTKKQQTAHDCITTHSTPLFHTEAHELATYCASLSPQEIATTMKISDTLAATVVSYYQQWATASPTSALCLFTGEAFSALNPHTLSHKELSQAQHSLRILSGLYGILRPFDATAPYRLEIAYKLPQHPNLYTFWKEKITTTLCDDITTNHHSALIDLASKEYTKAINFAQIPVPVITPLFMEYKGDKLKTVAIFAKRARGAATRFLLQNPSEDPAILKEFTYEGYAFNPQLSTETQWYFTKGEPHVL